MLIIRNLAYDQHQCKNHYCWIAEISFNDNCISQITPMCIMWDITLNITLHGLIVVDFTKSFYSMIASDKLRYTNHFLYISEINYNYNCISQIIPMSILSDITLNITLHYIALL